MRTESLTALVPVVRVCIALCLCAAPDLAAADWPAFGRAVATAPGDQLAPTLAADGAGGAILVWLDFADPVGNLFAQHVLASGDLDPAWPLAGRALMTDPLALANAPERPAFPAIAPDGAGGAFVAWQHGRDAVTSTDIFVQHVLASGAVDPAWPANGAALCVVGGVQDVPTIVSDGAGGAFVTWMDGRPGASVVDLYAHHVLGSGVVDPAWPANGAAVSTAAGIQAFPNIVPDGAGGGIITWYDLRDPTTSFDIYAQRILSAGVVDPAWPVNGRALCTAPREQFEPRIVSDGAHGAIVTWYDIRNGVANRVFAQHVLASGAVDPAWPVDGQAVSGGTVSQENPCIVADGAGGAIVAWQERQSGLLGVFAQHLTAAGVVDPAWPAGGRTLTPENTVSNETAIASDGAGGAIVAWQQGVDIFAQHVLAAGALDPTYPALGRVLCNLPSDQRSPVMVAAGAGGAIVAWTDTRNGPGADIFAMQVLAAGTTDVPGPEAHAITFARPSPNPARGPLTLRFALPRPGPVRLAIYDATGRRVRELASGARPAGEQALTWDLRDERGTAVNAGLYFARLEAEGRSLAQKLVTLE